MTLGDVLRKERQRRGLSAATCAEKLDLAPAEYANLEGGTSPAEQWGPCLGRLAIKLEVPTSRLICESGRAAHAQVELGQSGRLIAARRRERGQSVAEVSAAAEITPEILALIERGDSPIEQYGPLLLRFAELVDQPIFNLMYPCGLPLEALEDYP
jgi:transcriptional regulator with XRE-family HTH domain